MENIVHIEKIYEVKWEKHSREKKIILKESGKKSECCDLSRKNGHKQRGAESRRESVDDPLFDLLLNGVNEWLQLFVLPIFKDIFDAIVRPSYSREINKADFLLWKKKNFGK